MNANQSNAKDCNYNAICNLSIYIKKVLRYEVEKRKNRHQEYCVRF